MAGTNRKSRPITAAKSKGNTKSTGPRLPSALRKHLDTINNPISDDLDSGDDDDVLVHGDEFGNDIYEYQEEFAEEESRKNRRFDPVDNFEYQLPDNFKDEEVLSEDDDEDEDDLEHDKYSDDEKRHARLLHNVTGIPPEAFEGKKRKRNEAMSEAYPESEFNPSLDVLNGDSRITIEDLLAPLGGDSKLRKKIKRVEEKGLKIHAPLSRATQDELERKTAYDLTKKHMTENWEGAIKKNRETPTLFFDSRIEIRAPTVGTIASEFKPRTDYEKSIASLLHDEEIVDAYQNDGSKLLEMNKISFQEEKDRQDKNAKMRSILFRHEMKAKHINKIKSKTYHRLKKKDKLKSSLDPLADPEAARELAEKQERKRAEARMTMRHKNQGKWAKRVLERGLDKQDEGTRASISEQLHMHNLLTRKMNSGKNSSSSNEDSTDDDEDVNSSDEEGASKLVAKAKEKTRRLMEHDNELPDSGVLSLPFMVRGLEKKKEAASEEAKRALEEYESLNQHDENAAKGLKPGTFSGKRVFGAAQTKVVEPKKRHRPEVDNYGSENEDAIEESNEHVEVEDNHLHKDAEINLDVLREDFDPVQETSFGSVDGITVEDPGSRTSYDVSVFAAGSWKKMKSVKGKKDPITEGYVKSIPEAAKPSLHNDAGEEVAEDSDSDNDGQMVDGMLSSGPKQTYELPSNEELLRRAFAGDDVEEEFHKAKEDVLNEENPEPEKPLLLPGWGNWASVQKKKGLPSWMSKQHADAKQKREVALKKRKDARFGHVIISEKIDKKAEKLYLKTLPYPFTSQEVFDQSNRNPLGPEFNPATIVGAITRPEVVKKSGVIIPPISLEEVNPHEKGDDKKHSKKKPRTNSKNSGKRPINNKRT